MERWNLMLNEAIKEVDKRSQPARSKKADLSNSLKTVKKVFPRPIDNQIYGQRLRFDIPTQYDNLADIFIKITLSSAGNAAPRTELATRVFKQIQIRTKKGTLLQDLRPLYSLTRVDEITKTPTYDYVQNAIDPDTTFDTNTVTMFLPLFTFFAEDIMFNLPTRSMEPLEVYAVVNDSKEAMGLQTDLSATAFEMHCVFYDTHETEGPEFKIGAPVYGLSPPRTLLKTYDTYYEELQTVPAGSTSARMLITNPNPAYVMHIALVDPLSQAMTQIKTIKMTMAGVEVVDLDYRINFSLDTSEVSLVDSSTISYWFSKEKNRSNYSGLIDFSSSLFPTYLDITFDALPEDYQLHVFFEHLTKLTVSNLGEIVRHPVGYLKIVNQ